MAQRVGMCVPSGCTVEDAATNYIKLYKNIGAWLHPNVDVQPSLTEDYFFEGYFEGNEFEDTNITPKYWTWGQWFYV